MTFDFLAMKTTSTAEKKAEKERRKEEERAKAQAIEQVCVCVFSIFVSSGKIFHFPCSSSAPGECSRSTCTYYLNDDVTCAV